MNLQSQIRSLQERTRGLTLVDKAKNCCALAKQLEKAGEYEVACEALQEFWPERIGFPKVEGLDEATKAAVLLRAGALAGWLGSADQAEGQQETAKNLITRSVEIFEKLEQPQQVAEARGDLALCYWREGAYDEARIQLETALSNVTDEDNDLKSVLLIRKGMIEIAARRLTEALQIFNETAPLLEESTDHALKGTFHNQLAVLCKKLSTAERDDYADRALIEYAAASFHFEEAGHTRFSGCIENNLASLYLVIGRYQEAHEHLDRARDLFIEIGDDAHLAQANDTRARTMLAEGRLTEAERFARSSVKALEKGGEHALLAEALTTCGIVKARLANYARAKVLLEDAIRIAETAGDLEGAGRAKLSIIEELREQIPATQLASIFESAADLLQGSQDPSAARRLISCARKVIDSLAAAVPEQNSDAKKHSWESFSFKKEILRIEAAVIERALRDAGGSVTRAARLLGFSHHQSLIHLINSRHKGLAQTRSAVRKRRQHLFSKPRKVKRKFIRSSPERASSQISILHVEDNQQVAKLIADMFAEEQWIAELCADGYSALDKLTGKKHYDLLLVDNEIPGLSGLELVQRAKTISHRRRTPIIMLSGDDIEKEAWRAGIDAFLRKPEGINKLSATIARVLEERREKSG